MQWMSRPNLIGISLPERVSRRGLGLDAYGVSPLVDHPAACLIADESHLQPGGPDDPGMAVGNRGAPGGGIPLRGDQVAGGDRRRVFGVDRGDLPVENRRGSPGMSTKPGVEADAGRHYTFVIADRDAELQSVGNAIDRLPCPATERPSLVEHCSEQPGGQHRPSGVRRHPVRGVGRCAERKPVITAPPSEATRLDPAGVGNHRDAAVGEGCRRTGIREQFDTPDTQRRQSGPASAIDAQ